MNRVKWFLVDKRAGLLHCTIESLGRQYSVIYRHDGRQFYDHKVMIPATPDFSRSGYWRHLKGAEAKAKLERIVREELSPTRATTECGWIELGPTEDVPSLDKLQNALPSNWRIVGCSLKNMAYTLLLQGSNDNEWGREYVTRLLSGLAPNIPVKPLNRRETLEWAI